MSRILVTGGAGFIGSHLARRLARMGARPFVVDNFSNSSPAPDLPTFEADITRPGTLDGLDWDGIGAVCHLAAQSSGELSFIDPQLDMQSHVLGTFNMLEECRKRGISRFLYASSTTIYGDPERLPADEDTPPCPKMFYSAGKLAAEGYVRFYQRFGVRHTILRMPNVYGPGQNLRNMSQGMVSIYLAYMLRGEPILVKGGRSRTRDFIHVDDVVDGWLAALDAPAAMNRTYNLGSGESCDVDTVLGHLKSAWGDPDYPVRFLHSTDGDQEKMALDVRRIRSELGFSARLGMQEGIADMVAKERMRQRDAGDS